jgi:hypothetical protein
MNYLHNYKVRKNIMGLLLLTVLLFGTLAAFADTLKDALDIGSSNLLIEMAPFAGYIALGAIILYIPLNILDKRLYEKALKEHKEKGNN